MKKSKIKLGLRREEAAQELSRIAGQLAEGVLKSGEIEFSLPVKFRFDLEVKEKDDKFVLQVVLKGAVEKEEIKQKKQAVSRSGKRPYKAKKLKKALGGEWKEIKRCIRERSAPGDTSAIRSLVSGYEKLAEPAWKEAWDECGRRLLVLVDRLERGEFDGAEDRASEIDRLIKSCHRKYK